MNFIVSPQAHKQLFFLGSTKHAIRNTLIQQNLLYNNGPPALLGGACQAHVRYNKCERLKVQVMMEELW